MPQVGNKKYPYTKEGMQQANEDKKNLLPLDLQKNFNKERIALHQTALKNAGFYKGDIDSIWGPKSQQAYNQYQADPQARMRGAGAFGKDATGNPRTPFRDAMNFIKKKSGKIEDIFIDKMGDVGANDGYMDEKEVQRRAALLNREDPNASPEDQYEMMLNDYN